jgi:oxygen-independent coproporphyrinogen-3 oxidase
LFHQSPPQLPDDEPIDNWQIANQQRLAEAGYLQYEVSAYAKKGCQSRHNLNYWQFGDYLGIGAGAHGKLTSAASQSIERLVKQKQPQAYLDKVNSPQRVMKQEPVGINEIGFEFMLNALRLTEGFATPLFLQHCGVPLATIKNQLAEAEERGLIDYSVEWIRPTELGQRYLNSLIELFLPQ